MTDPYQCGHCGAWFVVRCLARDCEKRHAAIASLAEDITPDLPPDRVIRTR